jgi:transcription initiation factor TFIIH subunit 3
MISLTLPTEDAPSLLTIVLDTNPHAWAELHEELPLSKAVANILVFINAHLAFNNANQIAVIASHTQRAVWLYPRASAAPDEDADMLDVATTISTAQRGINDANKYRPFARIEHDVLKSLRELVSSTTEHDLATNTTTQMAGALTLALSYINKATIAYSGSSTEEDKPSDGSDGAGQHTPRGLRSRIFVLSVSGDLAHQYIPIMNTTFAAQSKRIPIDILKLAGDTVFLQQACDATKGIYLQPRNPQGLLQYLMVVFLPDQAVREHLVVPTQEVVDFRAACFCHRNVVDIGFVCSICLSSEYLDLKIPVLYSWGILLTTFEVFCSPPEGAICLTCGTHLTLGDYGGKPAVIPRKSSRNTGSR